MFILKIIFAVVATISTLFSVQENKDNLPPVVVPIEQKVSPEALTPKTVEKEISPKAIAPTTVCADLKSEIDSLIKQGSFCNSDKDCGSKENIPIDCSGGFVPTGKYTDFATINAKIKSYKNTCGLFCPQLDVAPVMCPNIVEYSCKNNQCRVFDKCTSPLGRV
jgi:hypothetical protein